MDFNKIKQLASDGGKLVFIEDGEIAGVFLSFDEYKKMRDKCFDNCSCFETANDDEQFPEIGIDDDDANGDEVESENKEAEVPPLSSVAMEPNVQSFGVDDLPF